LGVMSFPRLQAQEIAAWSKIDTNAIMIGQHVQLELGINLPEGTRVSWPIILDTLSAQIEVLKQGNIDTIRQNGAERLIQQFTITSFDSGYVAIPSQQFHFKKSGDTTQFMTSTGELFLQVNVPQVDTTQAIKPIVGPISEPYTFAEMVPWILVGLAAAGFTVLIFWLIRRRKNKKPLFERKPKPALPPHVVAINKLEELRLAKVWQNGKIKQYHSELTDIMREYLDNRYHFDAPEMTSDEILQALRGIMKNKEAMEKLSGVFFLSDMVKFAKAQPTALENDLSLSHCVDFVNETKEEPVATSPDKESSVINKELTQDDHADV